MKRLALLLTISLFVSLPAEAGWLDNMKAKAKSIVDNKVRETETEVNHAAQAAVQDAMTGSNKQPQASDSQTPQSNVPKYEFGKLQANPFWFEAPANSKKALDIQIKGLRLGMPEIFAEKALLDEGFTKSSLNTYVRIVKNGDTVIKRDTISFLSVQPSDEFIEELGEPLKTEVLKAKQIIEDNNLKKEQDRELARTAGRMARSMTTADNNIPNQLQLIYKITYNQSFNDSTRQDPIAMRQQMIGIFGEPSYANKEVSTHFLSGAAFDMNLKTDLYYHDAAHIAPAIKESLIKKAEVNEQKGVYDGFVHPCASGTGGRCPGVGMKAAYPNDFDLQMQANRIMHAPYMGIRFKGRLVETTLEWTYLQGEKSMREYHTKDEAAKNAPVATVDF